MSEETRKPPEHRCDQGRRGEGDSTQGDRNPISELHGAKIYGRDFLRCSLFLASCCTCLLFCSLPLGGLPLSRKDGMQWPPGQASEILTERVGVAASLGGSKRLANCQPSPRLQKLRRSFAARSQFRHTDMLMSSTTQLALRAPAPVSKANTDDDNRLSSSSIYGWLVWISNPGPLESV